MFFAPPAYGERLAPRPGSGGRGSRAQLGWGPKSDNPCWFEGGAGQGRGVWRGSQGGVVRIGTIDLEIDPELGPKVYCPDGSITYDCGGYGNRWKDIDSGDQKVAAYRAAKRNSGMQEVIRRLELERAAEAEAVAFDSLSPPERAASRCRAELARGVIPWTPIGIDAVKNNGMNKSPGMLYGLEFPWTAELLREMGPEWLTNAFHKAGTLHRSNKVTHVIQEKTKHITAGNNAGKFLFEVRYEKPSPYLHTKLFAKVPFPLGSPKDATYNDRLSSSVNKQPMDLFEINTYRLLESSFPMKVPKYYYGDISNSTSNFILILECVPFSEFGGVDASRTMRPFEIEGPYEKCKDHQLRGDPKEYYSLLAQMHARIAGLHKSGGMGRETDLIGSLTFVPTGPGPEIAMYYPMKPAGSSGEPPAQCLSKLNGAIRFFSETAKAIFPDYVTTEAFQEKFRKTMLAVNAYTMEIQFWKHRDPDYVAFGHNNLNMDNAYFWRDEAGTLDCGILDFGGFGHLNLPHKLWWGLNCAEFENIRDNLNHYIDVFINTYVEYGGPRLDPVQVERAIILTAFANVSFMVAAVPGCLVMCPAKEWLTITRRDDPRIAMDVGGKSTLRTTLRVLDNGLRVLEELKGDEVLEAWILEDYVGKLGGTPKTEEMITGKAAH